MIGLLPTGAGKSVCYQIPGIIRDGLTLVISPLIALMEDQVNQLVKRGIKAVFLHGGMSYKEIDRVLDNAIYGDFDFLYVSPERIHSDFFKARKDKMNLSLIAIDEAHCISQWGHDFRPSYLQIKEFTDFFPDVPITAFTATATSLTLGDIQNYLGLEKATIFRKSFKKDNLSYTFIKTTDKKRELNFLLERLHGAGIIYVRNRALSERLCDQINKAGFKGDFYHAGLTYEQRKKKQEDWINNKTQIIIATNAFGMGVDKADVRWVIHVDIPGSIEEYYQEAGRAGRDGKNAFAVLLYDDKDKENALKKIELGKITSEILNSLYEKLCHFFKIPLMGGNDETFNFDINLFSSKYKLPLKTVMAGVKTLEQSGILVSSEGVYSPSTLSFDLSKEKLFKSDSKTEFQKFLVSLVRNYEGLFTFPVKISEEKIARFTGLSQKQVNFFLNKINELEYGVYQQRNNFPKITFLCPRIEARSLSVDYKRLDNIYQNTLEKQQSMFDLILNEKCRESQILKYFDESDSTPCGNCDICKGSAKTDFSTEELQHFYNFLKRKLDEKKMLFDLLHWWPHNKRKKVLHMLGVLENENKLIIKGNVLELV